MAEDSALYWSREEGNLANLINKADSMSENEIKQLGEKSEKNVLLKSIHGKEFVNYMNSVFARINR